MRYIILRAFTPRNSAAASVRIAGGGISTFPGSSGRLRTSSRRKAERDKSANQQKGLEREQHGELLCK